MGRSMRIFRTTLAVMAVCAATVPAVSTRDEHPALVRDRVIHPSPEIRVLRPSPEIRVLRPSPEIRVIRPSPEMKAVPTGSLELRLDGNGLRLGTPVFIRIFKEESELELWMRGDHGWVLFQTYPICKWSGELGPKLKRGDKQAPEGFYRVGASQLNPQSRRYRAFNLGFPNAYDREWGRTGSYLMVHGGCTSVGCYAMTDAQVGDIYRLVEGALANGAEAVDVHAFPFRMTEVNMARHLASPWRNFWRELKRGYDIFEQAREIPAVGVVERHYVFETPGVDTLPSSASRITAWR
jgi:murein L,D-transpeptidase YafK